jgi:hypothetical protein
MYLWLSYVLMRLQSPLFPPQDRFDFFSAFGFQCSHLGFPLIVSILYCLTPVWKSYHCLVHPFQCCTWGLVKNNHKVVSRSSSHYIDAVTTKISGFREAFHDHMISWVFWNYYNLCLETNEPSKVWVFLFPLCISPAKLAEVHLGNDRVNILISGSVVTLFFKDRVS